MRFAVKNWSCHCFCAKIPPLTAKVECFAQFYLPNGDGFMLVLSRYIGESIVIGDDTRIVITVLNIKKNLVRIGIEATKDIPVYREEIHKRIQQEKQKELEQTDVTPYYSTIS